MRRSSSRPASPPCSQAADAAGAIRAWARMQAWRNPKIAAAARALDDTRHADPAAAAAWADRTGNRMRGAISIIERLRAEGRLDPTWTHHRGGRPAVGADLVPRLGRPGQRRPDRTRPLRRDHHRGRAQRARRPRQPPTRHKNA